MSKTIQDYYDDEGIMEPNFKQKIPFAHINWIQPNLRNHQLLVVSSEPKERPLFITNLDSHLLEELVCLIKSQNPNTVKVLNYERY